MAEGAVRQGRPEPGLELLNLYHALIQGFGPQRWWPARTRLEVILGAILTQNTAWNNARLAIQGLRRADLLNQQRLARAPQTDIENTIRSAGFFRQKAKTIRNFVSWLERHYGGSLNRMFRQNADELRRELLSIKGLGPETADAILLYAGQKPFFVADAYTRRVLERHEMLPPRVSYREAQDYLHRHLSPDVNLFNEYHALLVEVGKRYCRRSAAQCEGCPLEPWLPRRVEQSRTAAGIAARQTDRV